MTLMCVENILRKKKYVSDNEDVPLYTRITINNYQRNNCYN